MVLRRCQSVGSAPDEQVRDRINQGVLPGPRVFTSLNQIRGVSGEGDKQHAWTIEELREKVQKNKVDGRGLD